MSELTIPDFMQEYLDKLEKQGLDSSGAYPDFWKLSAEYKRVIETIKSRFNTPTRLTPEQVRKMIADDLARANASFKQEAKTVAIKHGLVEKEDTKERENEMLRSNEEKSTDDITKSQNKEELTTEERNVQHKENTADITSVDEQRAAAKASLIAELNAAKERERSTERER